MVVKRFLYVYGALCCFKSAFEFYEESVADCLYLAAIVSPDNWAQYLSMLLEEFDSQSFVHLGQGAVTDDIREHYRCKSPVFGHSFRTARQEIQLKPNLMLCGYGLISHTQPLDRMSLVTRRISRCFCVCGSSGAGSRI